MYTTCPAHLILFAFILVIISCESIATGSIRFHNTAGHGLVPNVKDYRPSLALSWINLDFLQT
jgi:hypothetical protein